ncbi:NAT8L synthetase, partial [Centropus bengalensis]|nr:NAT8L synthetase [Centropus bengalensis]
LELRRLSVGSAWRGRGIARALCGHAVAFARARGCATLVLATSAVQVPAQRLYHSLGFRRVGTSCPSPLAALLGFQVYHYQCQLPGTQ